MRQPNAPEDWPEKFLAAYRKNGNVSQSARLARVDRRTVQRRRDEDEAFAAEMSDAQEEAADVLEQEAWRRAKTGTLKPVFYKGEEVGKVREYSDALMVVLLKAVRPEKFRENIRTEMTGKGGEPIEVTSPALEAAKSELEIWREEMTGMLQGALTAKP